MPIVDHLRWLLWLLPVPSTVTCVLPLQPSHTPERRSLGAERPVVCLSKRNFQFWKLPPAFRCCALLGRSLPSRLRVAMAAPSDGGHNPVALMPGTAAAAAAATLQPTPNQRQLGVEALPPAHLQLQQHPQQLGQQQRLGTQAAVAQLSLPFVPLGAAGAFPQGLVQLHAFGLPGQTQQQAAPLLYTVPPGAAPASAAAAGGGGAGDPVYVNPRQLAGILRRRKQREKEEAKRRLQPRKAVKKVRQRVGGIEGGSTGRDEWRGGFAALPHWQLLHFGQVGRRRGWCGPFFLPGIIHQTFSMQHAQSTHLRLV